MKRFLPTLPAFLLCLFGGVYFPWHPWPPPDAQVGVPAMVGWLPNQEEGYQEWKEQCGARAVQATTKASTEAEIKKLECEEDIAKAVLDAVEKCEPEVTKVAGLLALQTQAKAITGLLVKSKEDLEKLAGTQDKKAKEPFADRVKWWVEYKRQFDAHGDSLRKQSSTLAGFVTKFNDLNKKQTEPEGPSK